MRSQASFPGRQITVGQYNDDYHEDKRKNIAVLHEGTENVSGSDQIQFIQNLLVSSAVGAGTVLGAQYWGKNDRATLQDLFNMILRFCGLISLVFFLACELLPEMLMHVFTHDDTLIGIGSACLALWLMPKLEKRFPALAEKVYRL